MLFALHGPTGWPLLAQADPGWSASGSCPGAAASALVVNGEAVEPGIRGLAFYRVEQVDGHSLLLRPEVPGPSGWATADQVILVDQAVDFFTQQIRADPSDAFCRAARAFSGVTKGNSPRRRPTTTRRSGSTPKEPACFLGRGLVHHFQKSYAQAIADFDRGDQARPQVRAAHSSPAESAEAQSTMISNAIADFSEAIWLDPLAIAAYENRGHAWAGKKEFAKAIVDYNMAIRLDPQHAGSLLRPRRCLARHFGNSTRRSPISIRPSRSTNDSRDAYARRASIWAACPDPSVRDGKKAVESATRACELTKWNEPRILDVFAAACAEAGDFKSAVSWQTRANALRRGEGKLTGEARLRLFLQKKPARDPEN